MSITITKKQLKKAIKLWFKSEGVDTTKEVLRDATDTFYSLLKDPSQKK